MKKVSGQRPMSRPPVGDIRGTVRKDPSSHPNIIKSRMTDFIIDGGLFVSGIFFSYLIDTMLALFQIIRKGKDYL